MILHFIVIDDWGFNVVKKYDCINANEMRGSLFSDNTQTGSVHAQSEERTTTALTLSLSSPSWAVVSRARFCYSAFKRVRFFTFFNYSPQIVQATQWLEGAMMMRYATWHSPYEWSWSAVHIKFFQISRYLCARRRGGMHEKVNLLFTYCHLALEILWCSQRHLLTRSICHFLNDHIVS